MKTYRVRARSGVLSVCVTALIALTSLRASAEPRSDFPIRNLDSIIDQLGFRPYYQAQPARPVKIAVFDNGFAGYEDALGESLPENTELHSGPIAAPQPEENHGLVMAQLLYGLMTHGGKSPQFTPELHLYRTFGYSNLKAAIEDSIARQMDVILYSQVWEYGGNFDGHGFINALISEATERGILWVNAAGNFGETTFNSEIRDAADRWINLPGPNESLGLRCEQNPSGTCQVRIVLSWNDFKDDVNEGTRKDLDLFLTDDTLNIVQSSNLVQTDESTERPGYSLYPREVITAQIKPGAYFIRIKNRSSNFGERDRLRVTVSGDFLALSPRSQDETLLTPADHPEAITVGASDSPRSASSKALSKPEISAPSKLILEPNLAFFGTSNSAAMVAAGLGLAKSLRPEIKRAQFIATTRKLSGPAGEPGQGLPLELLGFAPTGPGCFVPVNLRETFVPPHVWNALRYGGTWVRTTIGPKIFFPLDPIRYMPGIRRNRIDDVLVVGPTGTGIYARFVQRQLPPEWVEVLETPLNQKLCGESAGFYLPLPREW